MIYVERPEECGLQLAGIGKLVAGIIGVSSDYELAVDENYNHLLEMCRHRIITKLESRIKVQWAELGYVGWNIQRDFITPLSGTDRNYEANVRLYNRTGRGNYNAEVLSRASEKMRMRQRNEDVSAGYLKFSEMDFK